MPEPVTVDPGRGIAVCGSDALVDGGRGVRFAAFTRSGGGTGFVVRYQGVVRGYLNRCAHVGIELDWQHGEFFEREGRYLMCATHGAIYAPDTGRCAGGPCRGGALRVLQVEERDGGVFWFPDSQVFATDPNPVRPMPTHPL